MYIYIYIYIYIYLRKICNLRKDVIAIFHNEGLKITIDTNLTTTLYVNANSNHPPNSL